MHATLERLETGLIFELRGKEGNRGSVGNSRSLRRERGWKRRPKKGDADVKKLVTVVMTSLR